MKKTICTFTLIAVAALPVFAQVAPAAAPGVIKKTEKGVCHSPGTRYYSRVKHFESYKTLDECVKSGGKIIAKK